MEWYVLVDNSNQNINKYDNKYYNKKQVNILIPDGSIIQVHAWVDEPVEHFMTRIEEVQGTPYVFQRLLVHGRELNPRKTLEEYEVTIGPEGDVVELLMRDEPAIPKR